MFLKREVAKERCFEIANYFDSIIFEFINLSMMHKSIPVAFSLLNIPIAFSFYDFFTISLF